MISKKNSMSEIRRRPPNPSVKVANLEYAIPHSEGEPNNILEKILWEKDKEIAQARNKIPLERLKKQISELPKPKSFSEALKRSFLSPAIIAEVKKASPSKGLIREDFDPTAISKTYEKGGAACLSVLTEKNFFKGGFEVLVEVRESVDIPILCKDFIFSAYQLHQARAAGADAVLLIASILSDQDLEYLQKIAHSLGLETLIEVHNSEEIKRVINLPKINLIGINNRDLKSFTTDLSITEVLASKHYSDLRVSGAMLISESGISSRSDLERVKNAGCGAVLVGEFLMRQKDIASAMKRLING